MNAFKDLISLILFVISLLILYKTTNHTLSLLIIITIAISYIIKHYTLNNFLKKATNCKTLVIYTKPLEIQQ